LTTNVVVTLGEYTRWDAVETAQRIREGDVSAADVLECCQAMIDRWNPTLNAVADRVPPDRPTAPLDVNALFCGVPFAVKELLAVPGLPCALGSRLFAANVAREASPFVQRLLSTGLRVVCSTTSSEFGLLGSTESVLRGPTMNPWRPGLSAAGSSGGSAALVAAGIVAMAHASDAGGSIRVPASVTGLFGFKPSNQRCAPTGPDVPGLAALVVDHVISRTVRDSAELLAVTERTGSSARWTPIGRVTGPRAIRLRIGTWSATLLGGQPSAEVAGALTRTRRLLESLGHGVIELEPPPIDGAAVSDAFFAVAALAMSGMAKAMTPILGRPPGAGELEPFTLALIDWATTFPPDAPARADAAIRVAAETYQDVFTRCDVVLTPTVARPPWTLGYLAPHLSREELVRRTEEAVGYTPIHNIAGCPAMSVPLQWVEGLPIGMHFAATAGADASLLALAYELEEAAPWRDHRPDLTAFGRVGTGAESAGSLPE
jgi:amidase